MRRAATDIVHSYDPIRMSYYHDYMEAILISLSEGVSIIGCLAWSFLDNYEVSIFKAVLLDQGMYADIVIVGGRFRSQVSRRLSA